MLSLIVSTSSSQSTSTLRRLQITVARALTNRVAVGVNLVSVANLRAVVTVVAERVRAVCVSLPWVVQALAHIAHVACRPKSTQSEVWLIRNPNPARALATLAGTGMLVRLRSVRLPVPNGY